jgi:hypothetical protein
MEKIEPSVLLFGLVPFKTAARIDRETGTGIIEIESENQDPVLLVFSDTNAALALTEALLHLSQEMIKNDTPGNMAQQVGEYCIVGDDTAQLAKSVLSRHASCSA